MFPSVLSHLLLQELFGLGKGTVAVAFEAGLNPVGW